MKYDFKNEPLDALLDYCFRFILTDRDAILKRDHPKHDEYRAILREIRAREKQYKGLVETVHQLDEEAIPNRSCDG